MSVSPENNETPESLESPESPVTSESGGSFASQLADGLRSIEQPAQEPPPDAGAGANIAAPAPPVETQETPPAGPSFLDQLAAYGFEGVADERDGQQRLLDTVRHEQQQRQQLAAELNRYQQLAHYGNEYLQLQQRDEFQEWQRSQQARQQAAQQQPQAWWAPPSVDNDALARYWRPTVNAQTGETEYAWADNAPPDLRMAVEKRQAYVEQWTRDLLHDPPKAIDKMWEGELKPRIDQYIAEREQKYVQEQTQQQAIQFAQQVQQQNASWIYATDPRNGQPLRDPVTNQFVPTQEGTVLMQNLAMLDRAIAGDPEARWQFATKATLGELFSAQNPGAAQAVMGQPQAAPQPTTEEINAQKKRELMQRGAGHVPSRAGSMRNPAASQNPNLSFAEKLANEAKLNNLDLNALTL